MTLNSFKCAVFFAAVYGLMWVLRLAGEKRRWYNAANKWVLLLASYAFITAADWRFSLCLLALTAVTWICGLRIPGPNGKQWLTFGVVIALAQLAVFKYLNFFLGSFCALLGADEPALRLIVPLGVSFYTFSAVGYLVDVHRGKYPPERDWAALALFLAFFPKLGSGPLVRADCFLSQLDGRHTVSRDNFRLGIQLIVRGFFRKMVLADHLGLFVDSVYAAPTAFAGWTVLLATFAYSLQIYFDFAGYSDIAIGMARMLGFEFDRNFDLPYLSPNPTLFWKRWHISLSSWLQDYLYISLGGNRRGARRTELNLMLTMLLGGLWHGADWSFLLWGGLHGLALIIHKRFRQARKAAGREDSPAWKIATPVLNFLFVNLCWIFFRADSIGHAFRIIGCALRFAPGIPQAESWFFLALAVALAEILFAFRRAARTGGRPTDPTAVFDFDRIWPTALFFVLIGICIMMAYYGDTAFIYGGF